MTTQEPESSSPRENQLPTTITRRHRHSTLLAGLLLGLGLILTACGPTDQQRDATAIPPWATANGVEMAVTDHPRASEAALAVLARGGNAVDATVAASFALATVRLEAGNLGGGGFMVVRMAGGEAIMFDCREAAPGAATAGMFLDEAGEFDPALSLASGLGCGVPGTVAGLAAAHARFGTLPWAELVQPAIDLAERGHRVDARTEMLLAEKAEGLRHSPESARIFLRGGEHPYREGEILIQPELAQTLRVIQQSGADGFYHGEVAQLLVDEVERWGGCMTVTDLANYRVIERQPVRGRFGDYEVLSAAPPASGGAVLILMLNMVENLALPAGGADDPWTRHLLLETMRRAYALRSNEMGDPDYVEVPIARLLDEEFARQLAAGIAPRTATTSAELATALGIEPTTPEGDNTTHCVVVDSLDNVVSFTTSLNAHYGSKLTVTGAGFLLNNTMDDFAAKPGAPNMYGLIQGKRNQVEPGKRPLSSMTPTILLRDGEPVMALGSPGGSRITNAVFQVMLNQLAFGMTPAEAVRHPRFHHQFLPDEVLIEEGAFDETTLATLRGAGHTITEVPWSVGHVHLATRQADGTWVGVADQRRGGTAAGR